MSTARTRMPRSRSFAEHHARDGGERAAVGLDEVLDALVERRVGTLLYQADLHPPGVLCPRCGWMGAAGESCPFDSAGWSPREHPRGRRPIGREPVRRDPPVAGSARPGSLRGHRRDAAVLRRRATRADGRILRTAWMQAGMCTGRDRRHRGPIPKPSTSHSRSLCSARVSDPVGLSLEPGDGRARGRSTARQDPPEKAHPGSSTNRRSRRRRRAGSRGAPS